MVRAAGASQYRKDPRARVADPDCFKEMKAHVLDLYKDVEAVHQPRIPPGTSSTASGSSSSPRCADTGPLPQPPDVVLDGEPPEPGLPEDRRRRRARHGDRHGNLRQAPPGTIPMRRVTSPSSPASRPCAMEIEVSWFLLAAGNWGSTSAGWPRATRSATTRGRCSTAAR